MDQINSGQIGSSEGFEVESRNTRKIDIFWRLLCFSFPKTDPSGSSKWPSWAQHSSRSAVLGVKGFQKLISGKGFGQIQI